LEVEKRKIGTRRKIKQNYFEYSEKLDFFESALKKNGETNKYDELYKLLI
jgi:hypothetical protein